MHIHVYTPYVHVDVEYRERKRREKTKKEVTKKDTKPTLVTALYSG